MVKKLNQEGIAHILLILVATAGFLLFLLISNTLNFRDRLFSNLFPKKASQAQVTPPFDLIGSPEVVFDWTTNRCEDNDIPDLPARAFKDVNGKVQLIATHFDNYRMIGNDLNTAQKECPNKIYASANDPNYANHSYHEWIGSTYTEDGQNIYGIVHNEWYGWLIDPKCSQANQIDGWVNSLTLLASTNAGVSYAHPIDYKVWTHPTQWDTSFQCGPANNDPTKYTRYGAFHPSNIIKKDNLYYMMFQSLKDPGGIGANGICLTRTADITSGASSWEVWTGSNWDTSPTAACAPINIDPGMGVPASLTYNTYLNSYILLGNKWDATGKVTGVYYTLSQDLFNWTAPIKILDPDPVLPLTPYYPSLLDPNSPSRNFETTGQDSYLYYTRFNSGGGLDRDLLRQKIRFTAPSATSSGWDYNLTHRCVKSVAPSSANYYEDLTDCPVSGKNWTVAVESEKTLLGSCPGPVNQSFKINDPSSPVTLSWLPHTDEFGRTNQTVRLKTDLNNFTHPCGSGYFTWVPFIDHAFQGGGPFPNPQNLKFSATVNYDEQVQNGASRLMMYYQGVWDSGKGQPTAHEIEINLSLTNWGDAHPDADIIFIFRDRDAFGTDDVVMDGSTLGNFIKIDGMPIAGYMPKKKDSKVEVDFTGLINNLTSRDDPQTPGKKIMDPPINGWTSASTTAVGIATESRSDTATGGPITDAYVTNFRVESHLIPPPPPPPTPIDSFWSMDEASWNGTSGEVIDSSGNNNHATSSCNGTGCSVPTTVAGKLNNGGSFDGVDDYLLSSRAVFDPSTTDFTAAIWFKISSIGVFKAMITQQDGTGTGRAWLRINAPGQLQTNIGGSQLNGNTTVSANTWYHAALVKSGSTVSLYLNGILDGSATRTAESATGATVIGAEKAFNNSFVGILDEARIYKRALTANEIYQLANTLKVGDINGDGSVNVVDFSIMLSKWNTSDAGADLNGDGIVNVVDFSILLSNWGT